jgi:hypothetical protein
MKRIIVRISVAIAATLLFLHAVLSFGMLGQNEFFWILVISPVVFFFLGPRNSLTFSVACAVSVALLTGLIILTGLNKSNAYRPSSSLADYDILRGVKVFKKDQDLCMDVDKGDLAAQYTEDVGLNESRSICWITDTDGYRNRNEYTNQPYVLSGDSYIAGISLDQTDTLSRKLGEKGLDSYNIGYPGGYITQYARHVRDFKTLHPAARPKILLFFYEGNDFNRIRDVDHSRNTLERIVHRIREFYRMTTLGRFTQTTVLRLTSKDRSPAVDIFQLAGRKVGFHKLFTQVCERETYSGDANFRRLFKELAQNDIHVIFIPVKYRVYYEFIHPDSPPLPNAQWNYLKQLANENGVPATNLTKPLRQAATRELAKGRLLWWRGDTHWNPRGVEAAAQAVRRSLVPE